MQDPRAPLRFAPMELPRLVMKFGGTSVGDAGAIRRSAGIVLAARARRPAVVVSAAAGITDALVKILEAAAAGDTARLRKAFEERHRVLLRELDLPGDLFDERFAELRNLLRGIELLREVTPRTSDLVLSFGERLMAPLFAAHLGSRGLPARAWVAGDLGLVTDHRFTRARPLPETYERIPANLRAAEEHVVVMTGYLGVTENGQTTTLGRGGSDYSASILARAVGAKELEIWTDVDGILTADPRIVPGARLVERLSFREASELAYSGAKVLHPSTITPALEGKIPVKVLNSHRPERPGTTIVDESEIAGPAALRSIAHKLGVQVVTVLSPRMLARHGFISRIAEVFDRHSISIDMISTSEVSVSLTTDATPAELVAVLEELRAFSTVELDEARGMVCVVGNRLGEDVELVGAILRTVTGAGHEIQMISYGTTRTNLSFLVQKEDVGAVVTMLHKQYFEE